MNQNWISKENLDAAHQRIKDHLHRSPVLSSQALNEISGAELFFKVEGFQKTGSFKARGASNAILQLDEEAKAKGVATHSSGNHGQALAWAAQNFGIPCHVIMPSNAPAVKIAAVKGYGATVHLCEPNLEAREAGLAEVQSKYGVHFIPPYDHPHIIAGQSSAGAELLEAHNDLDYLMAPVGGGGLLAGTALAAHFYSTRCKVIAGEPAGADDAYRSFYSGERVTSHQPKTIADGLLTTLGAHNFPIIQDLVEAIITVSDEEIIAAMKLIYTRMKLVIEPSAAVPFAALLQQKERFAGQKVGIILSGANVDLAKLPF